MSDKVDSNLREQQKLRAKQLILSQLSILSNNEHKISAYELMINSIDELRTVKRVNRGVKIGKGSNRFCLFFFFIQRKVLIYNC